LSGRKIGVLNVADKIGGEQFDEVDLSLLEIIGPQIAVAVERAEWQERATQFQLMSITDPLTGLLNRRYLEERLTDELNRSQRYNYPMSCLMIDIDDFKTYNDRNGHQAGDVALKITAHALKAALRGADVACRYGGEEFCILLPQTSLSEAGVIAERIRQTVSEKEYRFGKSQPLGMVSVSIGISTFAKHIDTAESIIAAADRALYNAKSQGKNRIDFYVDNISSSPAAR
jgi:diguanylate cyclase (GGDEF)-like protein